MTLTLIPETILLILGFFCIGYTTSRPRILPLCLSMVFWLISVISAYLIKKVPILKLFPVEYTLFMKINESILILFIALITYGIPFIVGYYTGKVVNNVEKYQRK
ncbi:hypothetical protein KAU33_02285 [Candidatus Dependentiae bacterium]|nr:hypothetical protein [Candidatus Dependentiae bacterium]